MLIITGHSMLHTFLFKLIQLHYNLLWYLNQSKYKYNNYKYNILKIIGGELETPPPPSSSNVPDTYAHKRSSNKKEF